MENRDGVWSNVIIGLVGLVLGLVVMAIIGCTLASLLTPTPVPTDTPVPTNTPTMTPMATSTPTAIPTVVPTPILGSDTFYWVPLPGSDSFQLFLDQIGARRGLFEYFEGVAVPGGKPICIRIEVDDRDEYFECFAVIEGIWVWVGSVPINGEGQTQPFSAEEIALAQIIQGEADHEFMRDDGAAAYAVGWVAKNRLGSERYGASYQELQAGFNGTIIKAPKRRYPAIARLVINGRRDPTDGALYVLSQQDMDKLGFDEGQATLILRASEHRALFFFEEWQGETRAY